MYNVLHVARTKIQDVTRKPRKGAAVIVASMYGFDNCRKFKYSVTLTLTLDGVTVTSTYTVYVGLPAYSTMVTVASPSADICGHLNVVKYRHSVKFEL